MYSDGIIITMNRKYDSRSRCLMKCLLITSEHCEDFPSIRSNDGKMSTSFTPYLQLIETDSDDPYVSLWT